MHPALHRDWLRWYGEGMSGLNPKQRRFVEEYLVDGNGTQAAIRAGYSRSGAQEHASRLLLNVIIQEEIQAGQRRLAEETEVSAEKVIKELAAIAFSDIGQIIDFEGDCPRIKDGRKIPKMARRAISSMKISRYTEGRGDNAREVEVREFKLWSKTEALKDLARHLGLLSDSVNVNMGGGIKVDHGFDLSKLTNEQLVQLRTLVRTLKGPPEPREPAAADDPPAERGRD